MTREEVKKLYDRVCDAYPNFKPNNPQFTFDLWCEYLGDRKYEDVEILLDEHIRHSEYAPTISQLIADTRTTNHGFNERKYSKADYEAMEKDALEEWGRGNE